MITYILPGFSPRNKSWADEVAASLNPPAGGDWTIRPIYWDHWENPNAGFKHHEKADLIAKHAKGDKVNIIAKSVGTLVCAFVVEQIPAQINKIILCGVPSTSDKRLEIYSRSFSQIDPKKIIVFQNYKDPFAGFVEVKNFMAKISPKIKVFEKQASDHNYPYYDDFNDYLTS